MREIIPFISIAQLKIPLTISGLYFAIGEIFQVYIFNDWNILIFLMLAISIDTITGFYKAWKKKEVNPKKIEDVAEKVASYCLALILVHILTNFTQEPALIEHLKWFRYAAYLAFISKEVLSSMRNIEEVRPGTFPKWIMTRLQNIEETGKIDMSKDLEDVPEKREEKSDVD